MPAPDLTSPQALSLPPVHPALIDGSFAPPAFSPTSGKSRYIDTGCCSPCWPCDGRPPNKVPKTLYITLTGPFGIFGNYSGTVITLIWNGDHFTSGCLGPSGTGTYCYDADCFGIPNGAQCSTYPAIKKVGALRPFNSFSVDFYLCGSITVANWWSTDCTPGPNPNPVCGVWPSTRHEYGYPVAEIAMTCGNPFPCSNGAWTITTYPMKVCWPTGFNCCDAPANGPFCAPINFSVSGIPTPVQSTNLCVKTVSYGGSSWDVSWSFVITE